jgi:hypothetical protein
MHLAVDASEPRLYRDVGTTPVVPVCGLRQTRPAATGADKHLCRAACSPETDH